MAIAYSYFAVDDRCRKMILDWRVMILRASMASEFMSKNMFRKSPAISVVIATVFLLFTYTVQAGYSICRTAGDQRVYHNCANGCKPGDTFVSYRSDRNASCRSPTNTYLDCGQARTKWISDDEEVVDPCPFECVRGDLIGVKTRLVGEYPPVKQSLYKFQCWREEERLR